MHNWYFIEIYDGKKWKRLSYYENYLEYEDAVRRAEELSNKYESVRIKDECYKRVWLSI